MDIITNASIRDSEKGFVESLALESEKIREIDSSAQSLASKNGFSDLVGWNEVENSVFRVRSPVKTQAQKPNRILPRRNSSSEAENYRFYQDPCLKTSFLQKKLLSSCEKKLPIIVPNSLIPKFHAIQAPLKRSKDFSLTSHGFCDKSQSESPVKVGKIDFTHRSMQKNIIYPIDLMKKQELLYDFYPIKPVNKTFEISFEQIQNSIRPRNFSKLSTIP